MKSFYSFLLFFFLGFVALRAQPVSCEPSTEQTIIEVNNNGLTTPPSILSAAPLPAFPPSSERVVYFLHGLGGNASSWADVSTDIGLTYEAHVLVPSYDENGNAGITENALFVKNNELWSAFQTLSEGYSPDESFMIAHSLGGIVSRKIWDIYDDQGVALSDRSFRGLVTFGSAHGGTKLGENLGLIEPFFSDGCNSIIAGPAAEEIQQTLGFASFLVDNETVVDVIEAFCAPVVNLITPLALDELLGQTTEELAPGNNFMLDLNQNPELNLHKVAFYGEEQTGDTFWRLIYHFFNDINANFDTYGANDDGQIMVRANENTNNYEDKRWYWSNAADELSNLPSSISGMPFIQNKIDEYNEISSLYAQGYFWWRDASQEYLFLAGIDEVEEVLDYVHCECINDQGEVVNTPSVSSGNQCVSICTGQGDSPQIDYYYTYEVVQYPSDGVVRVESAIAFPGAVIGDKLDGSNHFQMRNDSQTERALEALFIGTYGSFFETEERE